MTWMNWLPKECDVLFKVIWAIGILFHSIQYLPQKRICSIQSAETQTKLPQNPKQWVLFDLPSCEILCKIMIIHELSNCLKLEARYRYFWKVSAQTWDLDILLLLSSGLQTDRRRSRVTNARDHISANAAVEALNPYKLQPEILREYTAQLHYVEV